MFRYFYTIFRETIAFLAKKNYMLFVMLHIAALLLSSLCLVFLYLLINFVC